MISTLGALLILRPSGDIAAAVLYGLGMAISFSLYVVLTRSLRHEPTATNLFYSALVVFVPLSFAMPAIWKTPTARDALIMASIGILGLAVLWAIDRACELVPVSAIATLFPLQLVLISILLPLLTGLRPSRLALVGMALVIGSAIAGWVLATRPTLRTTNPIDAPLGVKST